MWADILNGIMQSPLVGTIAGKIDERKSRKAVPMDLAAGAAAEPVRGMMDAHLNDPSVKQSETVMSPPIIAQTDPMQRYRNLQTLLNRNPLRPVGDRLTAMLGGGREFQELQPLEGADGVGQENLPLPTTQPFPNPRPQGGFPAVSDVLPRGGMNDWRRRQALLAQSARIVR